MRIIFQKKSEEKSINNEMTPKEFIYWIADIVEGFFNLFLSRFKNIKNKSLYDSRYSICHSCEWRDGEICGICHCYLKAKTKSHSPCPLKKW